MKFLHKSWHMRFFLLSSLLVLGLINMCLPVQVEIYASHCALDRSLLPVKDFQVGGGADLPEEEEPDTSVTQAQKNFVRKGLETLAEPWIKKLKWI